MSQMPGYMRRMAITRSMFAVNGNDASMGAENGVELLYHPRWKTHLLYVSEQGQGSVVLLLYHPRWKTYLLYVSEQGQGSVVVLLYHPRWMTHLLYVSEQGKGSVELLGWASPFSLFACTAVVLLGWASPFSMFALYIDCNIHASVLLLYHPRWK